MAEKRQQGENPASSATCDVVVIGAGLAGKAASLHLSRAGLNVICISPSKEIRRPVGESLDWSAPDLLKQLGLPMERLVEMGVATWKRHVTLNMADGCSEHYGPSAWLGKPPFNIELKTLHVDRVRLDQQLLNLATEEGVKLVPDTVVSCERIGRRVSVVRTGNGTSYSAPWFIDASGTGSSLFAREFRLPRFEYGPAKVAIWKYFSVSDPVEGTTLYADASRSEYLEWIWEIPINPDTVSVGLITTGTAMKARRENGSSVDEIYALQLAKFPRFEPLLRVSPVSGVNVTSFKCHVNSGVAGPNWLICGEAAAMVDPITSNGVTAALRHAAEASALILRHRGRGGLPAWARMCYSSRILRTTEFFNGGIEDVVYQPPVRNRIGLQKAGKVYTGPAWSMNVVYARLKPFGMISTLLLHFILGAFRLSARAFYRLSRRGALAPG